MARLVQGVGLNDVRSWDKGKRCPFYSRWSDMLKRCYSEKYHVTKPSYAECSVCDDWLTLSKFKSWMEEQDWEGKQLDKDLLIPGNKEYSPEACVFIANDVNQFINSGGISKSNGSLEGVTWMEEKGKYKAQAGNKGANGYIGLFLTEEGGHKAYLMRKYEMAVRLASLQSDPRVAEALLKRYKVH